MTIELRDLRLAIVASQHRSLRQAATTLNIRQSTLSRRLRDLEYCLGATVFERTNGGTRPTTAGLEFLEWASRILDETESALRIFRSRSNGEEGQLKIGVQVSPATGNMHATLAEHHRRFPDVNVVTLDGTHDRLREAVMAGVIDVSIMTLCRTPWNDGMLPLWSERLIVAIHDQHPLATNAVIHWPDLLHELIHLPTGGPGPEFERLLATKLHGRLPPRTLRHDSGLDRLLSLVSTDHGALLMLEGATGLRHVGVLYRELHDDDQPTRLDFAAYWRKTNDNPTLAPFLTLLRERYPDLSDTGGPP